MDEKGGGPNLPAGGKKKEKVDRDLNQRRKVVERESRRPRRAWNLGKGVASRRKSEGGASTQSDQGKGEESIRGVFLLRREILTPCGGLSGERRGKKKIQGL